GRGQAAHKQHERSRADSLAVLIGTALLDQIFDELSFSSAMSLWAICSARERVLPGALREEGLPNLRSRHLTSRNFPCRFESCDRHQTKLLARQSGRFEIRTKNPWREVRGLSVVRHALVSVCCGCAAKPVPREFASKVFIVNDHRNNKFTPNLTS